MTVEEFRQSLSNSASPLPENLALTGLWWDAKGNWTRAHESAQQDDGPAGAWVHAYLHRKEGDDSNARYWYSRAGKQPSSAAFEAEWDEIAAALLSLAQLLLPITILSSQPSTMSGEAGHRVAWRDLLFAAARS